MPEQMVIKSSGDLQAFSTEKLAKFLRRIRVPEESIQSITKTVSAEVRTTTSTGELRKLVSQHLGNLNNGIVFQARYNLKRDLRQLGPAGHLFEQFIGKVFEADGFEAKVSVIVQGECATHEIDVIATKDNEHHMVECKFHNQEGIRSDLQVALYTFARFLDVQHTNSINSGFQHAWLVTNTKMTTEAEHYARCKNMRILTVEAPYENAILEKVMDHKLYPISSLDVIDQYVPALLNDGILLAQDILGKDANQLSAELSIPVQSLQTAQSQAKILLDIA